MKSRVSSFLILFFSSWLQASDSHEFIQMIRISQNSLAQAQAAPAEVLLVEWENTHPEVRENPLFWYQRFFVALEGRGDRATARQMLDQLTRLVDAGSIPAESAEYLSVTEAWYRSLLASDSDLLRQANRKMTERISHHEP